MAKSTGRVSRPERVAYLLGLALLGLLGLAASVLGLLSLWQGAVVCLGLGLALLAPLLFLQARRQLKTFKAALRQMAGSVPVAGTAAGQADVPAREVVSMLSRTNRQLTALSEQARGSAVGVSAADQQKLDAEITALRTEMAGLRGEQEGLHRAVSEGWAEVRADLQAMNAGDR